MKKLILLAIILLLTLQKAYASDITPLIPEKINIILGSIKPNMPKENLDKLIFEYHPDAEYHSGPWSGGTGYFSYKISENYQLDIAGAMETRDGYESREWVHPSFIFNIIYINEKRRIDISEYKWE